MVWREFLFQIFLFWRDRSVEFALQKTHHEKLISSKALSEYVKCVVQSIFYQLVIREVVGDGLNLSPICCEAHRHEQLSFLIYEYNCIALAH